MGCGCQGGQKVWRVEFNDGKPSQDFVSQTEAQRAAAGGKGKVRPVRV